ncbi:MAG: endo-1,4-beta-xylanase [Alkalibacterium sp.]|nr:endo-1,4-beta-xylanase [Alkalibacterium sp.]
MTEKQITLKEAYKDYFKIGVAVNPKTLKADGELIRKHFNSLTPENHMKPEELQPKEGEFTFETADKIVDFAKENDMELRGHTFSLGITRRRSGCLKTATRKPAVKWHSST